MFVNLTKHPINLYRPSDVVDGVVTADAKPFMVIPAGQELRVVYSESISEVDGVPVKTKSVNGFNQTIPDAGNVIVSFQSVVALKSTRHNLRVFTADGIVKDKAGAVIGCTSLVEN